jgi:hypothetical protein
MTAQIISFTYHRFIAENSKLDRKTMRTVVFRNRKVILEVDEATLLNDVRSNIQKAERKLDATRRRLESVKKHMADEIAFLTAVEAKLGAAVRQAKVGPQ